MSSRAAFLVLAAALLVPAPGLAAKPAAQKSAAPAKATLFKLKPGANGPLCLDCHGNFADRLAKKSVHTPVRSRDCVACHDPHASSHGKLLDAEPSAICVTCHPGIVPKAPKSEHEPVAKGRCADCHDPHATDYKANLVRGGTELCAACHTKITEAASKAKFKHRPVEQSCAACHAPHGSAVGPDLLKAAVPGLCVACHDVTSPALARKHMGYPVKGAQCTSCHNPHGSNADGLMYAAVHPPVAKGQCSMCHEPVTSKNPLATRQQGVALCKQCHSPYMAKMQEKNRVHQPVAEGECLACHGAHGSKQKGLIRGDMGAACGACHADTIRRQDLSPTKHQPIKDGECTSCHDPHGSDRPLMFVNDDGIELCGGCHDWHRHSSHPIGPDKIDPRNRNLFMECSSCHRAHGTGSKHLIPFPKVSDLCTKCHEKYKR